MKPFVPSDSKANEISALVSKEQTKEEEKKEGEEKKEEETEEKPSELNIEEVLKEFKELGSALKKLENIDTYVKAEEFEKDNDQNFHIDFIFASANCRASNYKLEEMSWINVKLKAGRIIPALATTTAAVAGLQTLELVKLLASCKLEQFRNCFLNLAVPSFTASEPGTVEAIELREVCLVY